MEELILEDIPQYIFDSMFSDTPFGFGATHSTLLKPGEMIFQKVTNQECEMEGYQSFSARCVFVTFTVTPFV